MKKHTITQDDYQEMDYNNEGMCIKCGNIQSWVEPDAEGYECEECGAHAVMGTENLLLRGYVV